MINLPRPIIKPFDMNNFTLAMINYSLVTIGKASKYNQKIHLFYIESVLQRKYNEL